MANEENPIIFTITYSEGKIKCYTKDLRVEEENREVEFDRETLLVMMQFITDILNRQGYAVLFEAE